MQVQHPAANSDAYTELFDSGLTTLYSLRTGSRLVSANGKYLHREHRQTNQQPPNIGATSFFKPI